MFTELNGNVRKTLLEQILF